MNLQMHLETKWKTLIICVSVLVEYMLPTDRCISM